MGRAILMLLGQIEALQAELGARSSEETPDEPEGVSGIQSRAPAAAEAATDDRLEDEALHAGPDVVKAPPGVTEMVEDATRISLRERARDLARHLRAERRTER